jgi:hypothetical protein
LGFQVNRQQFMNWQEIIKEAFFSQWQKNSEVDITDYSYRIERQFNLGKIEEEINMAVAVSTHPETEIARQLLRLENTASIFALKLLETSDDGKTINALTIVKAKQMAFENAGCPEEDR